MAKGYIFTIGLNTFYMTAANGYITNSTTDGSSFSFETIPNIQFIRL